MKEMKLSEMLKCQYDLWELHKDEWDAMRPKDARNQILWMIEELGETIAIIKKKGEDEIMSNPEVKARFTEEFVDVFMYYLDVLNRYQISAEDFSKAYYKKHQYNLERNYKKQHQNF